MQWTTSSSTRDLQTTHQDLYPSDENAIQREDTSFVDNLVTDGSNDTNNDLYPSDENAIQREVTGFADNLVTDGSNDTNNDNDESKGIAQKKEKGQKGKRRREQNDEKQERKGGGVIEKNGSILRADEQKLKGQQNATSQAWSAVTTTASSSSSSSDHEAVKKVEVMTENDQKKRRHLQRREYPSSKLAFEQDIGRDNVVTDASNDNGNGKKMRTAKKEEQQDNNMGQLHGKKHKQKGGENRKNEAMQQPVQHRKEQSKGNATLPMVGTGQESQATKENDQKAEDRVEHQRQGQQEPHQQRQQRGLKREKSRQQQGKLDSATQNNVGHQESDTRRNYEIQQDIGQRNLATEMNKNTKNKAGTDEFRGSSGSEYNQSSQPPEHHHAGQLHQQPGVERDEAIIAKHDEYQESLVPKETRRNEPDPAIRKEVAWSCVIGPHERWKDEYKNPKQRNQQRQPDPAVQKELASLVIDQEDADASEVLREYERHMATTASLLPGVQQVYQSRTMDDAERGGSVVPSRRNDERRQGRSPPRQNLNGVSTTEGQEIAQAVPVRASATAISSEDAARDDIPLALAVPRRRKVLLFVLIACVATILISLGGVVTVVMVQRTSKGVLSGSSSTNGTSTLESINAQNDTVYNGTCNPGWYYYHRYDGDLEAYVIERLNVTSDMPAQSVSLTATECHLSSLTFDHAGAAYGICPDRQSFAAVDLNSGRTKELLYFQNYLSPFLLYNVADDNFISSLPLRVIKMEKDEGRWSSANVRQIDLMDFYSFATVSMGPYGNLYFVTKQQELYSLDLATGAKVLLGTLNYSIYRLAFDGSTLYGLGERRYEGSARRYVGSVLMWHFKIHVEDANIIQEKWTTHWTTNWSTHDVLRTGAFCPVDVSSPG